STTPWDNKLRCAARLSRLWTRCCTCSMFSFREETQFLRASVTADEPVISYASTVPEPRFCMCLRLKVKAHRTLDAVERLSSAPCFAAKWSQGATGTWSHCAAIRPPQRRRRGEEHE